MEVEIQEEEFPQVDLTQAEDLQEVHRIPVVVAAVAVVVVAEVEVEEVLPTPTGLVVEVAEVVVEVDPFLEDTGRTELIMVLPNYFTIQLICE